MNTTPGFPSALRSLLAVALCLFALSCSDDPAECETNADCGSGEQCTDGECVSESSATNNGAANNGSSAGTPDCETKELLLSTSTECDCEDPTVRTSCTARPTACETLIAEAEQDGSAATLESEVNAEYCGCLSGALFDEPAESTPYCNCIISNGELRVSCKYPE